VKFPWWMRSTTIQVGTIAILICFLPQVRRAIHEVEFQAIQFQALFHIVLRFKTEERPVKLSEENKS